MTTLDIESTEAGRFIHAPNFKARLIDLVIQPLQKYRQAPVNLTGRAQRPSTSPGTDFVLFTWP